MPPSDNEGTPLFSGLHHEPANPKTRGIVWGLLTILFAATLVIILVFPQWLGQSFSPWMGLLPDDPALAALAILDRAPVLDGHIDLAHQARVIYANNATAIDLNSRMPGQVDIPRLRQGKVGGFFWSTYVSCPRPFEAGWPFTDPNWLVRDTLEQIDISKLLIEKYSETFQFADSTQDIETAVTNGKIAGMLGVAGGHQLGNSLGVLRQYHALGVRYIALVHECHNAFADSCEFNWAFPPHGGLSSLGKSLVKEMNRLGVLVDLSHTSDATAKQTLNHTKAPVIWSHSSARGVYNVPRNVPDNILRLIGTGEGQVDAVVMVTFAPALIAVPGNATIEAVADHIDHIANVAGKKHVGLGSDYDGIDETPVGLEDVSKYPALINELYRRGWDRYELAGLTGANLLRVFKGAERVAKELQDADTLPAVELYKNRPDLPEQCILSGC